MMDLTTATAAVAIGWMQFVTVLLLLFGLFLILAGVFTAYFGSGKSRTIGVVLLVVGLAVGILAGYWYHLNESLWALILQSLLLFVAGIIGALLAIGIFLVAIMKS
jgi:hypothetical protein